MKVNLKQEKGITLIALVITIVVLLILAGVTIAMLTGENGILTKVTTAKDKTAIAEAKEKVNLMLADWKAENLVEGTTLDTYLMSGGDYTKKRESFSVVDVKDINENNIYKATVQVGSEEYIAEIDASNAKNPVIVKVYKKGEELDIKIQVFDENNNDVTKSEFVEEGQDTKITFKITVTKPDNISIEKVTDEEGNELTTNDNKVYELSKTINISQNTDYEFSVKTKDGKTEKVKTTVRLIKNPEINFKDITREGFTIVVKDTGSVFSKYIYEVRKDESIVKQEEKEETTLEVNGLNQGTTYKVIVKGRKADNKEYSSKEETVTTLTGINIYSDITDKSKKSLVNAKITASSCYNNDTDCTPDKAFDDKEETCWSMGLSKNNEINTNYQLRQTAIYATPENPQWLEIEFDTPRLITIYSAIGVGGGETPEFTMQASNDNVNWENLEGDTKHEGGTWGNSINIENITLQKTGQYKYYRILYTKGGYTYGYNGMYAMSELLLFNDDIEVPKINVTNIEAKSFTINVTNPSNKYSEYKYYVDGVLKSEGNTNTSLKVTKLGASTTYNNIKVVGCIGDNIQLSSNIVNGVTTLNPSKTYLYKSGDKCEEETGGWTLTRDTNSKTDIDSYDYMLFRSEEVLNRGSSITTNNAINLSGYKKLKMIISKENLGTYHYFRFGVKSTPITDVTYRAFSSDDLVKETTELEGENLVVELDISSVNGEYYVGFDGDTCGVQIYEIWLE